MPHGRRLRRAGTDLRRRRRRVGRGAGRGAHDHEVARRRCLTDAVVGLQRPADHPRRARCAAAVYRRPVELPARGRRHRADLRRIRRSRSGGRTGRLRAERRRPRQHHRRSDSDRRILVSTAEQQSLSGIAVDIDHNPYLAEGAGTVDAIISVAVGSEMVADIPPERVEAIIIDCSTSMLSPQNKFEEAKRATKAAVNEMVDGAFFTIIAGSETAEAVYPDDGKPTRASETTRAA